MLFESLERLEVDFAALALDALGVPLETEPGEVFVDALDVFVAGPAPVVVLDAEVDLQLPFM